MSVVRFISDLHFGHKFMAEHRGFPNTECHDQNIIAQWNLTVNKRDTTYILGDISMHDVDQYKKLSQLAGRKVVVLGNHDASKGMVTELSKYVDEIYGVKRYSSKEFGGILLTHVPIHPIEFEHNFNKIKFNIHGHIHMAYEINDPRYINVSAENIDYIPKTLDELLYGRI